MNGKLWSPSSYHGFTQALDGRSFMREPTMQVSALCNDGMVLFSGSELTNDRVWKMLHPHRDWVGVRLPLRKNIVDLIGTAIHEDPQPCCAHA